ncbi:MAG: phage antirepressor N-terminal domain-containing protein [Candidatus Promineifilaceae bacterium]
MSDEITLTPVEQKTVNFYGDDLLAIRAEDGQVYVSLRHLCEALGLARQGQVRRIRDHKILSEGYQGGNVLLPPSPEDGRGGGVQRVGMLRVDLVPLWLSGVRVRATKEEIRPKLERFQAEAAKVLWEAFQEGRLTVDPSFSELLESDSPAAQAYRLARAMMELARNQLLLESRLDTYDDRFLEHEQRLEGIEAALGAPDRFVTPDQASQISQAVKTVAMKLSKQSGRNEYGGVYGELYRKFGITSYKQLPAAKFDEAMGWLNEWRESVEGEVPF